MKENIKLIIFDLDDTLIHSNINYSQIRNQIAELFVPTLSDENITKTPILELLEKLRKVYPSKFTEGYKRIDEAERKAAKNAMVIPGAQKLPSILKKFNIFSAIFTNNSRKTIKLYLANPKFNFLKRFQILTRDDFKNPKPNPEGLISIIEGFNIEQITKDNTIYVGDSYIDAIAAYQANIRFIWFNSRDIDQNLFPTSPYATMTNWSNFESILIG
ncbi:MAG: HAD family hydrolase [Candidatus Hodarchaeales archaeon]|jgi:HAD superfamily hydrolase (TIGR01549 family)